MNGIMWGRPRGTLGNAELLLSGGAGHKLAGTLQYFSPNELSFYGEDDGSIA
jgi:hypothetical protein